MTAETTAPIAPTLIEELSTYQTETVMPKRDMLTRSASTARLYGAIVKAQVKAQGVTKNSENKHHGYEYASSEDVITEARAALGAAGLAFMTLTWWPEQYSLEEKKNDDGSSYWRFPVDPSGKESTGRLHVIYRLVHESGEWIDLTSSTPILPEKGRPQDKAEATALTYNLSYSLRNLLCLPRVEDNGDAHGRNDAATAPASVLSPASRRAQLDHYLKVYKEARNARELNDPAPSITAFGFNADELGELRAAYTSRKNELSAQQPATNGGARP